MSEQQEKQLALLLTRYAGACTTMSIDDPRRKAARLSIFKFVNGLVK